MAARRPRNSSYSPPPGPEAPDWVAPQLSKLVDSTPEGPEWAHECKFDGYRMHARIADRSVRLLTRTGLDWTEKFPGVTEALQSLRVRSAYMDGELCGGVSAEGVSSFSTTQAAEDAGEALLYVAFDLLHLDGEDLRRSPFLKRKERLAPMLREQPAAEIIRYSEHQVGGGPGFYRRACELKLEGVVSKRLDAPYVPRQSRSLGQIEMPEPGGVRRGRLDGPGGLAAASRGAPARISRTRSRALSTRAESEPG